jgi:hypothetical protein
MNAARLVAPATVTASGFSLALLIAASVTALVAVVLVVATLRRSPRLTMPFGWFSAAGVVAIIAGALLVGGALTPSPTAVAEPVSDAPAAATPRGASDAYPGAQLDGPQLETLGYDDGSTP